MPSTDERLARVGQQLGDRAGRSRAAGSAAACCGRSRRTPAQRPRTSGWRESRSRPTRDAEHARQHDAGERDPQRVAHADGEGAQVAVARAVVEQQLADVEAGRIAQEVEARLDLPRREVRVRRCARAAPPGRRARSATAPCDQARGADARSRARQAASPRRRRRRHDQRIGGAYIRPPLVHRLLTPRGSPTGVFGPRLRSKLSP